MKYSVLFLLPIVFLTCTHIRDGRKTVVNLTPETFWNDQKVRKEIFKEFRGDISLNMAAQNQKIFGKGRMVAKEAMGASMDLRDPLGRTQLLLTLSGNNFWAFYPQEKLVYADTQAGKAYFKKMLGTQMDLKDLQALVVGILPWRKKQFDSWVWNNEKSVYHGELRGKGFTINCFVDPYEIALTGIRLELGSEITEFHFSDFSKCCSKTSQSEPSNISLAHHVSVEIPRERTSLKMDWKDISNGQTSTAFNFSAPKNIRQIDLQ